MTVKAFYLNEWFKFDLSSDLNLIFFYSSSFWSGVGGPPEYAPQTD